MKRYRSLIHLSVFGAWAVAFGCTIGWDVLVLPWTVFLPDSGPLGSLVGIIAGALLMAVIAWNFHYMIRKCPGPGGVYCYAKKAFGPDHGFICAWFLCLAYSAIVWADSTVLAALVRFLIGDGWLRDVFTCRVAGHEVYFGDMFTVAIAMGVVVSLCLRRRVAAVAQIAFALMLVAGLASCFGVAAAQSPSDGGFTITPLFSPGRGTPLIQFMNVFMIAPWLFVGFEAISAMSAEFRFPRRRSFAVMVAAIVAAAAAYIIALLIPFFAAGDAGWPSVVGGSGDPIIRSYNSLLACLGRPGRVLLGVTLAGALFTNLAGNTLVASRIVAAMADDGAMPQWLGRSKGFLSARSGILCITLVSVAVSLMGEGVLSVIVDISLVGVSIAYIYTSFATFRLARREGNRLSMATGLFGTVLAAVISVCALFPVLSATSFSMDAGSFLVLAAWCVSGIISFLFVFWHDVRHRFGHSPAVWTSLFVVIILLSHMWARQTAREAMTETYDDIVEYHNSVCMRHESPGKSEAPAEDWHEGLRGKLQTVRRAIVRNSYVQSSLDILALALMFAVYMVLRGRERDMEREKAKAKSYFFSTVSHDIRTPLNAIIGYTEMLKDGIKSEAEREQALDAIVVSGKTLLGLVNDVLDLSKLESGKMEIRPEPTDCARLLCEVTDAFRAANGTTSVDVRCRAEEMPPLVVDPQRIRQIAFNLVGNAVKFTEKGHVELQASFLRVDGEPSGTLRIAVEDTGCGIDEEDIARLGSAYVQVGSRASRNGGTGLGLAICRQLASAMGGRLEIESTLGRGSTFTITIPGVKVAKSGGFGSGGVGSVRVGSGGVSGATPPLPHSPTPPLTHSPTYRRILIVDDSKMNRMVLKAMLEHLGLSDIAFAEDGHDALDVLHASGESPFDLVLTDMWMPNLDGAGLVQAMRADSALRGIRVVVVTADVEFQSKYASMGFDGILLKPITKSRLAEILSKE